MTTPRLAYDQYSRTTHYPQAGGLKVTTDYERMWGGEGFPDVQAYGEDYTIRPHRLRVRWMQNGEDPLEVNSIELTGIEVLDHGCTHKPKAGIREMWSSYHLERGLVPEWLAAFVTAHAPTPIPVTITRESLL